MTVAFYTLGCKVNQYETQALQQLFAARGHRCVPFEETADAYVINTCSVTAVSDKKSRQVIRRARKTAPNAVIAVCGCYSQTHPDAMDALGVDLAAGTGERVGFVELVEQAAQQRRPIRAVDDAMGRRDFELLPPGGLEGRTRAMLKVEDGCVNFCSYCIIPYARGRIRSLPADEAARQAAALQTQGYREIVITGIEISSWGQDLPGRPTLIALVEAVCAAAPECRVRLGSLEPRTVTEEFCARAAALSNLCPHFHLSLQSGCDSVLARMRRKYDSERFLHSVSLLRAHFDRPAVTTDLIVGFPGETEAEFETTLRFIRRCAFAAMHVFPYSRRPGTPAASMSGQVPNAVKERRAHLAAQAAGEMERDYLNCFLGETLPVLFEQEQDGLWLGYTANYLPVAASGRNLHNRIVPVTLKEIENGVLRGDVNEKHIDGKEETV